MPDLTQNTNKEREPKTQDHHLSWVRKAGCTHVCAHFEAVHAVNNLSLPLSLIILFRDGASPNSNKGLLCTWLSDSMPHSV